MSIGSGRLQAQADSPYFGMVAHESGPAGSQAVVVAEHDRFADNGITPDAQFNGLLKDENNYVMAWTGIGGNFGIDLMIDGELTNSCCSPYRLQPGDRWAFVLDGNAIAIWIDGGLGWSQLHTATTQDRIDFTAPGALDGWHYAVGMRSGGVQGIASLEGRSRASDE